LKYDVFSILESEQNKQINKQAKANRNPREGAKQPSNQETKFLLVSVDNKKEKKGGKKEKKFTKGVFFSQ